MNYPIRPHRHHGGFITCRISADMLAELQHKSTPFRRTQKPFTPSNSQQMVGLCLIGLCVFVAGVSLISVTTQVANIWTTEAQQEINSRIDPSRWNF